MEEREDMVEARRDLHNYILARYQSASRPSGRVHVTLFAPSSRFSDASFSEGRISTAPHPNMPPMRQTKGNRSLRTGHGSNLTCSQPKMPPRSNLEASSTHDLGAYNWAYVPFRYLDSGLPSTARPCPCRLRIAFCLSTKATSVDIPEASQKCPMPQLSQWTKVEKVEKVAIYPDCGFGDKEVNPVGHQSQPRAEPGSFGWPMCSRAT